MRRSTNRDESRAQVHQGGSSRATRSAILSRTARIHESLIGLQYAGLVSVPVNFRLAPDEVAYVLTKL